MVEIYFKYSTIPFNKEREQLQTDLNGKYPQGIPVQIDDEKRTITVNGKTLPIKDTKDGIALDWGKPDFIGVNLTWHSPSEELREYFEDFTWLDYGLLIIAHVLKYGK